MKVVFSNFYENSKNKPLSKNNQFIVKIVSDSDPTLEELIELFENFLYACGYRLPDKAQIGLIYEDDNIS